MTETVCVQSLHVWPFVQQCHSHQEIHDSRMFLGQKVGAKKNSCLYASSDDFWVKQKQHQQFFLLLGHADCSKRNFLPFVLM